MQASLKQELERILAFGGIQERAEIFQSLERINSIPKGQRSSANLSKAA